MKPSTHYPTWSKIAIPIGVALLISFQEILKTHFSLGEMLLFILGYGLFGLLIGMFYSRQRATHQPYGKLGMITGIILWTAFFIAVGILGLIKGRMEAEDLLSYLLILTLGQFFPAIAGYGFSILMRATDPHPMRQTRAGVIRFVVLFVLLVVATVCTSLSLSTISITRWLEPYLLLTAFGIWLAIASAWK
jgi:hypothetical protein